MSSTPSLRPRKTSGKPRSSINGTSAESGHSDSSTDSIVASGAMKPKKAGQSSRSRRAIAARELSQELIGLRSDLHQMLERYQVRVGGQIEELIATLNGESVLDQPARLPTLRRIAALEQVLRETKLRPKKGRPKDFERLEATVAGLMAVLEE